MLLDQIMYERNLTVRQVSYKTGVPKSTVSKIQNGGFPRIDVMERIAKGLEVRISDLYESDFK